jgi:hypothetical protein
MSLKSNQEHCLLDGQARELGKVQIDRIQGDLVFGRFTAGAAYAQVEPLFAEYAAAANEQLLGIVGELDEKIAGLNLRLRTAEAGGLPEMHDVQIGNGTITFRILGGKIPTNWLPSVAAELRANKHADEVRDAEPEWVYPDEDDEDNDLDALEDISEEDDQYPADEDDWDAEDYEHEVGDLIDEEERMQEAAERRAEIEEEMFGEMMQAQVADGIAEWEEESRQLQEEIDQLNKQYADLLAQGKTEDEARRLVCGEPPPDEKQHPTETPIAPTQAVPPSVTWNYDDSGYYAYVLLTAEPDLRDRVADTLKKNRLCHYWGTSYRPASNGLRYQWFIRIATTPSRERDRKALRDGVIRLLADVIGASLAPPPATLPVEPPAVDPPMRVRELERQLGETREEIERHKHEIASLRAQHTAQEETISRLNHQLLIARTDRDQVAARLEELTAELAKEKGKGANDSLAVLEKTLNDFRGQLTQKDNEIQELEGAWFEADALRQRAESQTLALQERLQLAETERDELRKTTHEPGHGDGAGIAKIADRKVQKETYEERINVIISCVLRNIRFLRGSVDVLFKEFRDPTPALRKLAHLVYSPDLLGRVDKVEQAPRWRECHCSTGSTDDGRLYFLSSTKGLGHYVLISHKQSQKGDYRFLAEFKE